MLRSIATMLVTVLTVAPATLAAVPAGAAPRGDLTVSAAASLTEAFTELGRRFERRHPQTSVRFNFGSSAALVAQIRSGAPADVFASADRASMDELVRRDRVAATPSVFARNRLQIAVKPGNPDRVASLRDLTDAGTVALCGSTVPCGVYAARVLRRARVTIPEDHVTRGVDAKATLAAVGQSDAVAAIVYATDVRAAGRTVDAVAIPDAENVVAAYPIAPVAESGNRKLAKAFVRFVTSAAGRRTLVESGFLAP